MGKSNLVHRHFNIGDIDKKPCPSTLEEHFNTDLTELGKWLTTTTSIPVGLCVTNVNNHLLSMNWIVYFQGICIS